MTIRAQRLQDESQQYNDRPEFAGIDTRKLISGAAAGEAPWHHAYGTPREGSVGWNQPTGHRYPPPEKQGPPKPWQLGK